HRLLRLGFFAALSIFFCTASSLSAGSGRVARSSCQRDKSAASTRRERPSLPLLLSLPVFTALLMTPLLQFAIRAAWVTVSQPLVSAPLAPPGLPGPVPVPGELAGAAPLGLRALARCAAWSSRG